MKHQTHKHHKHHKPHEGHHGHHSHHSHHAHHAHGSHHGHHGSEPGSSHSGFGNEKNDFANMPQGVVMKHYPKGNSTDKHLDDTITRIDSDSSHNHSQIKRHSPKSMW